jgi:hypothetical protein
MPTRDPVSTFGDVAVSGVGSMTVDPVKYESCTARTVEPVKLAGFSPGEPGLRVLSAHKDAATGMIPDGPMDVPDYTAVRIPT